MKMILLTAAMPLITAFIILLLRNGVIEISGNEASKKTSEIKVFHDTAENKFQPPDSYGYEVELTGVFRLAGSAPYYKFMITSGGADYCIQAGAEEKKLLYPHQGKRVKVKGKLKTEKHIYPNPLYNHEKRFIYPDSIEVY